MNKIKFYRVQQGLQLKDLSKLTGLSVGHLSHLENGGRLPSFPAMMVIAKALNNTVTDVFCLNETGSEACTAVEKGGNHAASVQIN